MKRWKMKTFFVKMGKIILCLWVFGVMCLFILLCNMIYFGLNSLKEMLKLGKDLAKLLVSGRFDKQKRV